MTSKLHLTIKDKWAQAYDEEAEAMIAKEYESCLDGFKVCCQ